MTRDWSASRYDTMVYRRCGRSGLRLPAISLGAWETFGGYRGEETARECFFRAFDLGITHFDFANNYGRPPGNAETVGGRILKEMPRDELIISTKAGYHMWQGPYGEWGSRKHLVASLDQSLRRLQLDYVDIFYSHRLDPNTPLEETLCALDHVVRQGKAIYAGVSNYPGAVYDEAVRVAARERCVPIVIHQYAYNMLNRVMETDLLHHTERHGCGVICFSPLAQGLLTNKYLKGIPGDSRAALWWDEAGRQRNITPRVLELLRNLDEMARKRGQTLAQMALAWVLRDPRVTSALIGASRVGQIEENVAALSNLAFSDAEIEAIGLLLK